jgi:lysyl-tRNA synthetase class 2
VGDLPDHADRVCLHGRLVQRGETGGVLAGEGGEIAAFGWAPALREGQSGDLVEIEGRLAEGRLRVERLRVLAPALAVPGEGGWPGLVQAQAALRRVLDLRARVLRAVREHFEGGGFLEVETPSLVLAPGQEAQIQLFQTTFHGRQPLDCCLLSSPEHHMKRLLGAGCERLFQIARAYRNGERSPLHHPEFSMLEWYRAYASYEEIMADAEQLVAAVGAAVCGSTRLRYQGREVELAPPWPRLGVGEAFAAYAGLELDGDLPIEEFRRRARSCCASVDTADGWEEIFFKVLLEKVEPGLAALGRPVLLKDFPAGLAALAKLRPADRLAERVEVYVAGFELANGFTELNDPREQRQRFAEERRKRAASGYPLHPVDEDFLAMMELGMPPAGGMALGLDRLVMLLGDLRTIDEALAFPFGPAEGRL